VNDRTFITLMRILPKASLSRLVGVATRLPAPARLHQTAAQLFSRAYRVDLDEAERPISDYPTFGDFFTRRLRDGARPIAPGEDVVISPVDGKVSEVGIAEGGRLIQAKGMSYTLGALLADPEQAEVFNGGAWATLYLAPRDYHRIHAPLSGQITGYTYVPGELWPVNPSSVRTVSNLFAANERLITFMSTHLGQVAVVKVGATCVGRIRAAYDEVVTHQGERGRQKRYAQPLPVKKGDELGVFEMGSTVIVIFEPKKVSLLASLQAGVVVRMGQPIGGPEAQE
jgi:phosphatidylserine decarboxylase